MKSLINLLRLIGNFFSIISLITPIAFLLKPKGSFSPVGISFIENKSISVVNLSAIASIKPNSSLGSASLENLGL